MKKNVCDIIVKSVQKLSENLYIKDILHSLGNIIITVAYRFSILNDYDSLTLASIDNNVMYDMDYKEI